MTRRDSYLNKKCHSNVTNFPKISLNYFNLIGSFIGKIKCLTNWLKSYKYVCLHVCDIDECEKNNLKVALCKLGLMYSKSCYQQTIADRMLKLVLVETALSLLWNQID